MFPVDPLARFEANDPNYRLLKPWWDILTDYLAAALLVIALLSGVIQASQGQFICLPAIDCPLGANVGGNRSLLNDVPSKINNFCSRYNSTILRSTSDVVLTELPNRRQYDYVDAVCGQKAVHWFASYFPFIVFLQAVFLLIIDNFWLKFPVTSSTMEHFVSLVTECFNTPGTCLAVSNTLWGTRITEERTETVEVIERQPDLKPTSTVTDAQQSYLSTQLREDTPGSLEVAEAMKVKTLYEKMKQFRKDQEPRKCICNVYLSQALLQCILSSAFLVINALHYHNLRSSVKCEIDEVISENYLYFKCSHTIIPYFQKILCFFFPLISLYILTSFGILCWTCCVFKKSYNFAKYQASENRVDIQDKADPLQLSDLKPAKKDLAFLLYLLDAYNELYSYRFSIFLSQKNEKKLKDFILLKEWPVERLQAIAEDNGQTLELRNLCGIPKSVFEMQELDSLKLELCTLAEDDFQPADWERLRLRALSLIHCGLDSIPRAVLGIETLEILDLSHNNITSFPREIIELRYLHTLISTSNKIIGGVEHIIEHPNIRTLNLRGNDSLHFPEPANELALRQLQVDEYVVERMSDTTKKLLEDILATDRHHFHNVIKYSPKMAPHIEQARQDNEKVYKMTSKPKGLALILNNQLYNLHVGTQDIFLGDRRGSEVDVRMLYDLFSGMGYYVNRQQDWEGRNFREQLREIITSKSEMVKCDSIIVAVLSHGSEEGIIFRDGEVVPVDALVESVCDIEDYREKPKLFFIQACRGQLRERLAVRAKQAVQQVYSPPHVLVSSEDPSTDYNANYHETMAMDGDDCQTDALAHPEALGRSVSVTVPSSADVLVSYSSLPGYVSWRNVHTGSWYIKSLVKVFSQYAWEEDVLSLLTYVNYEISRNFKTMDGFRQVPAPQSTLTKKLFFLPGYFEDDDRQTPV